MFVTDTLSRKIGHAGGSTHAAAVSEGERHVVDRPSGVGVDTIMKARLLLRERLILAEDRFAELVIWQLPRPAPGSAHALKYRLAFVVDEICVLRFDNEAGKGDHKHIGAEQVPYRFTGLARLVTDFWAAVDEWRPP
jgi:hypothetical protein